ncbi:MAG TPA: hypothetical protein VGI17_00920 [Solirubrobacterales bacterium]|jgi:hypothetical protein
MNPRKHLTYANVVSSLCLFMLLGGVAYAGTQPGKGSVDTNALKAEAVTKAKLAASSVNSKKVVDGSLTGSDIDASTLGKVPNSANAEHANFANSASTAGTATDADHATSADSATSATDAAHATKADTATNAASATNADHATSADLATNADHATTATDAETIDGISPGEFGPVLVASAEAEVTFSGELFFSVSGVRAGKPALPGVPTILPNRKFRATDFAVHFEGAVQGGLSVHVYLVVNGSAQPAQEVCTITEVPSTCTPSTSIEIPAGAQVAWKIESLLPVTARPEFALRLLPG